MKRISKILALVCVLALIASMPGLAFADGAEHIPAISGPAMVKNVIKGSGSNSSATSANSNGPSAKDITATGDNKEIVMPDAASYLTDYSVMYVDAPKEHSVYAHKQPWEKEKERFMPFAYHGAKVVALAEQSGYSCVLYRSDDAKLHAAWVATDNLSWDYPGRTMNIGNSDLSWAYDIGDPNVSWSKESFVGSRQKFTLLDTPVENCVGFTLDYQVTARNGAGTKEVLGPRTVYINDGDGWIEVGQFDYSELGPVHVNISWDEPITLAAVATVASCSKPDTFSFRQSLLDVFEA